MIGDKDSFRVLGEHLSAYADGSIVPHLEVGIYRNGIYRGYVELHTHRTRDDSISVGITTRYNTFKKP